MSPESSLGDSNEFKEILKSLNRKIKELPEQYQPQIAMDIEKLENCLSDKNIFEGNQLNHSEGKHDQQRAELDLLESDDNFRILADNIPQLAWIADASGWIFWYNKRWYEYTGTTFAEVEGWGWQSVHHPDTLTQVKEKFRYYIEHGEAWEDIFPLRRKDGQYRWFLSRAMPIHDRNGNVARWFGTNTDVTEQREIEQTLRESERRFRLALDAAPISVFAMDCDLRYTWLYKGRFGFSVKEMLGKRDDELNPENDLSELMQLKKQVIETGQGARQEVKALVNSEQVVYFDNLEPIFDAKGNVIGVTGAALDMTQQRRLEIEHQEAITQMEVQRRLLEHREQMRQRIARELHDGPIQSIVSTLFNLQITRDSTENPELNQDLGGSMDSLKHAVQELRDMVNELRPPALLHLGFTRAIMIEAQDFREKHPEIKLDLDVYSGENSLSEETCLELYRIYQECLNNIVRHAQASQVWVRYFSQTGNMVLEIKDNGVGFEVPANLVNLTRKEHFGMAGMRERVEAINGTIKVTSRPGQGTTVKVKVPNPPKEGEG